MKSEQATQPIIVCCMYMCVYTGCWRSSMPRYRKMKMARKALKRRLTPLSMVHTNNGLSSHIPTCFRMNTTNTLL